MVTRGLLLGVHGVHDPVDGRLLHWEQLPLLLLHLCFIHTHSAILHGTLVNPPWLVHFPLDVLGGGAQRRQRVFRFFLFYFVYCFHIESFIFFMFLLVVRIGICYLRYVWLYHLAVLVKYFHTLYSQQLTGY